MQSSTEVSPLITIITSTFNAGESLRHTAKSIQNQTYPHIQWIIADGQSTDNTLEVIKDLGGLVNVWFSEPDTGIYDAWNHALKHVKGSWIQFIGAGDEYYDERVLETISPILDSAYPKHDLVYGRLQYISELSREPRDIVGCPWPELKGRWEFFRPRLPIHPEVFHHASLFTNRQFDTTYKIAGDSHFLMQCIKEKDPLYVPLIIDKMPLGGASGSICSAHAISRETKRASRELGYEIPATHFFTETIKITGKRICCFLLSEKYLFKIANNFRKLVGKQRRW
jgi:glycosyltransferase involved in cell wall biosynthesis